MNTIHNRQIFLDTETTGINITGTYYEGHKIIEIGAVELINRLPTGNNFHKYLNPNRSITHESFKIHGISNDFLINKPTFSEIAEEFINYVYGAELIIHNAMFDVDFINYELSKLNLSIKNIKNICHITDSLETSRKMFPGKKNNLDALCVRYKLDTSKRKLHSAIIDAEILSKIFLLMTSGQISLPFTQNKSSSQKELKFFENINIKRSSLRIIMANEKEILSHKENLDLIQKYSGFCMWKEKFVDYDG
ncbi:DNA polymerase III subunit epsilon [Candidatus Pantoea edessiphila]|uniref:DNA polymerase III subunit epsilon n=1 Tax=Candidatus Pantoea edessiphila TaxID=2044610 RepID=A0A2P5SVF6_9GAMM|nr:DNA polymerase III subunit epsilon [Candidatus Pantoea edessiphila]PPI86309.1 DNA polymerase III subunit epsilon [Candidatus Pantoea edessiphila]